MKKLIVLPLFAVGKWCGWGKYSMKTRCSRVLSVITCFLAATLAGCGGGSGTGGGSGNSNSGATNLVPSIASISPSWLPAGATDQTLTITGTNFVNGSSFTFSGATNAGTLVSSTELQVNVSAPSTAGIYQVVVNNPNPGGGSSQPINFTVVGFETGANLNAPRWLQTANVLSDGNVLVAGGSNYCSPNLNNPTPVPGSLCAGATATAELYSPTANSFTLVHSMNVARTLATATTLPSGQILIAGGGSNGGYCGTNATVYNSAELYNPATQLFTTTGNMTASQMCATATVLPNGNVLIVGGTDGGGYDGDESLATAELYDPASGTFTATGSLNTARQNHTATLLPNGEVLIAGGLNNTGTTPQTYSSTSVQSAELYNPASGTFTVTTENLITARFNHTATLLPNGEVLIAGGDTINNAASTVAAELYNPANGTFASTGNLVEPRAGQTATLQANGQVLLVGGDNSNSTTNLHTAELYNPASGSFSATGGQDIPWVGSTATLLPNLQTLIIGGEAPNSELYIPAPAQNALTPTAATLWPSTAAANTMVVVQGTNFLPNCTISIDGQSVPSVWLDQTLLSFMVPAGTTAGNHTVSVVNPAGTASGDLTLTVP